eukprot:g3654.t1
MEKRKIRMSSVDERKLILCRLEKLEDAINKEKEAGNKAKYEAKVLRAKMYRRERDRKQAEWKNTHPLVYQTIKMNDNNPPSSDLSVASSSINSSRSSSSRLTNTGRASLEGLPITPVQTGRKESKSQYITSVPKINYIPYQFQNGTTKSPPATQRTESAWLQEPKHGRKKTIITTIPDLQYACTSIRRADGPGFQPLSARRHPTEITLCVDYVVNPTPAMIPIGASFHKTLTPMVKDREVAFTNTLPWRKSAEELKNEPKFVTWK